MSDKVLSAYEQLVRAVSTCLLWDSNFKEGNVSVHDNIKSLVHQCDPLQVAALAVTARNQLKLRSVPLLLVRELARHNGVSKYPNLVWTTLVDVIQRADEIYKFVELYWKDGKQPLSKQVKKGLGEALKKFNEYQLSKYSKGSKVSLRDVLFLVHAKPIGSKGKYTKENRKAGELLVNPTKGEQLFKRLAENSLSIPKTWETELSAKGAEAKGDVFLDLMKSNQLGALAFIKNLRGMVGAGVPIEVLMEYSKKVSVDNVLPFRFITAFKETTELQQVLEPMMLRCLAGIPKLKGKTVFVVDTSGSMGAGITGRGTNTRLDTACALAILVKELCEDVTIYATAGSDSKRKHATAKVSDVTGFDLSQTIVGMKKEIGEGGIFLAQVMEYLNKKESDVERVIVLTDEEDCDTKCNPENAIAFGKYNYIMNVSSKTNGVAYNKFTHISGFSEQILSFIAYSEQQIVQV